MVQNLFLPKLLFKVTCFVLWKHGGVVTAHCSVCLVCVNSSICSGEDYINNLQFHIPIPGKMLNIPVFLLDSQPVD